MTIASSARRRASTAVAALAALAAVCAVPIAQANTARSSDAAGAAKSLKVSRAVVRPPTLAPRSAARAEGPVVAVRGTAPDQAGYVHFFTITGPDGEAIHHVALELPGDRIAHSFPDEGVSIAPFVKQGAMTTSAGSVYRIEHLYGIRPFGSDRMRAFQQELAARVQPWVDAKTPYCDEVTPSREACVSCLSFAMSVLYPQGLPRDFKGAQKNMYTTEDLLMYLAGVPVDAPRDVRQKRIAALAVPDVVREDLARISGDIASMQAADAAKAAPASVHDRPATANLPKRVLTRRRS